MLIASISYFYTYLWVNLLLGCFAMSTPVAFVLIRYSASPSQGLEIIESILPTFRMSMGTLPGFYAQVS